MLQTSRHLGQFGYRKSQYTQDSGQRINLIPIGVETS